MGNTLNLDSSDPIVSDDPLLKDYRAATIDDFHDAKENFDTLQATVGDKMTVTPEEFDDIFSLICQDPVEHFELFDAWEVGKVDAMDVFAVIIVFCDATMEEKIPLLFDFFDFDHSKEMSQDELVLMMLCTTRGLCKVVGMPRPATDYLEALATDAFSHIDRSGQISLKEFTEWVLHERNVMAYLAKFANIRVIYDNQVKYDLMLKEVCTAFLNFADMDATEQDKQDRQVIFCPEDFCEEMIQRYCPTAEKHEIEFLMRTMNTIMNSSNGINPKLDDTNKASKTISMDTFFLVLSPYAAFLTADDDGEHSISIKELKILIWLLRGSEPSPTVIDSFIKSLKGMHGESLSAIEWVSCALETNAGTASQSFANEIHLLFATSDLSGNAMLSLPELETGLASVFAVHLNRVKISVKPEAATSPESAWEELTAPERVDSQRKVRFSSITSLITELTKEIIQELDANNSQRIEWYEFRQYLDYLEQRVLETKSLIQEHNLDP